jgi:hypothetical protein
LFLLLVLVLLVVFAVFVVVLALLVPLPVKLPVSVATTAMPVSEHSAKPREVRLWLAISPALSCAHARVCVV